MGTIQTFHGDLLNNIEGFIIHGCNAQGVMGSGVARGVRDRFPEAYEVYKRQHETAEGLQLGTITWVQSKAYPSLYIVNGVTQGGFNKQGQQVMHVDYGALGECFKRTVELIEAREALYNSNYHRELLSVAPVVRRILLPKIGALRGGGVWEEIVPIIEAAVPDTIELHLFVVDQEPNYCR